MTCTTSVAARLTVGQRVYSSKPVDFRVGDRHEKRELGAGTIAAAYADGRVVLHSEEHGAVEFSSSEAEFIEPRVQCPIK